MAGNLPPVTGKGSNRLRPALIILSGAFVLWAVAVALMVLSARSSAEQGLEHLEAVRELATGDLGRLAESFDGSADDEVAADAIDLLRASEADFERASSTIANPVLWPWRFMPVIGRQIRSVDALTSAAASISTDIADTFDGIDELLAVAPSGPEARLQTATDANALLATLRQNLADTDLGPDEALVASLADARVRLGNERDTAVATITEAVEAADGLIDFLRGPRRYLLMASNNAEMRAGAGMILQIGELTTSDGEFELSNLEATEQLLLDQPAATMDPDVERIWGWLGPTREWRNLNLTPRFDETARMAADMWSNTTGQEVDGVISVDVAGIEALLDIIGAVDVDGVEVTAATVTDYLLLEQYLDFEFNTDARRDRLGALAGAVFSAFNEREWSMSRLSSVMRDMGQRRHVLTWSRREVEQRTWQIIGSDGAIGPDSLLLSILNRNGTKLDQFLEVEADMTTAGEGADRTVTVDVQVRNKAPEGLPVYVQGPHPASDTAAGEYEGLVQLTVPHGSTDLAVTGGELLLTGPDGASNVGISGIRVPRGATFSLAFSFTLPEETRMISLEPSARIPASIWRFAGEDFRDALPRTIDLATSQ